MSVRIDIHSYMFTGAGTATAQHVYLDDKGSGTPSDNYTITVTATDDDGGMATGSATQTVNNVAPAVEVSPLNPVAVDAVFSLSGSFTDPGIHAATSYYPPETHTVEVDWGDGVGNTVRDVADEFDFWTIQVFAAYEYLLENDGDEAVAGGENAALGNTVSDVTGPVNIYLETIRDVSATVPGTVDETRLRNRVSVHEALHRFGWANHDVGIMNYEMLRAGTDEQVALTGAQLKKIISSSRATQ